MSKQFESLKLVEGFDNKLAKYSRASDQQYRVLEELVDDYFSLRFNVAGAVEVVPNVINVFDAGTTDLITAGTVSLSEINAFNAFVVDNDSSITIPNGIQVFIV